MHGKKGSVGVYYRIHIADRIKSRKIIIKLMSNNKYDKPVLKP